MTANVRPELGLVAFLLVAAALPGCVANVDQPSGAKAGAGPGGIAADGLRITGTVVDVEIRPLAGVNIVATPGNLFAVTDQDGTFVLGPVDPGDVTITAEGAGYRAVSTTLTVVDGGENHVRIVLTDPVGGQPYHETQIFVTYTFCATPGAPCAPINTVTNQNITPDRPDLLWKIPGPGLANMKYEVTWPPSLTSADKRFTTRNPEGLFLGCNQTTNAATPTVLYFSGAGASGFGMWVKPDVVNEGGCVKFDATDGKKYYTVNRPQSTNATIPLGLVVDQKIWNYLTFFFFVAGPDGFTAVPDS